MAVVIEDPAMQWAATVIIESLNPLAVQATKRFLLIVLSLVVRKEFVSWLNSPRHLILWAAWLKLDPIWWWGSATSVDEWAGADCTFDIIWKRREFWEAAELPRLSRRLRPAACCFSRWLPAPASHYRRTPRTALTVCLTFRFSRPYWFPANPKRRIQFRLQR